MHDIEISSIPLFSGLDRVNLARLIPHLERLEFPAGTAIFRQGDPGDCLYIIVQGTARVFLTSKVTGERPLALLSAGECIGEIALLTGEPRSANVEAMTDLIVLRLLKNRFDDLMKEHHALALYFAGQMASRLAAVNTAAQTGVRDETAEMIEQEESGLMAEPAAPSATTSSLLERLKTRRLPGMAITVLLCLLLGVFLHDRGLRFDHIVLVELLLAASMLWSFNTFNYNAVSLALPVMVVLFGIAPAETAFAGFASPAWFLVLAVFALSAAISKTGLMYRMVLLTIRRFPPSYFGQTLAMSLAGLILTPVIPSSSNRASIAGIMALNICDTLGFKRMSKASVGMAMAVLLGFANMSFLFMNGAAVCFFVLGLLPSSPTFEVTWSSWLRVALPLGAVFFLLSFLAILLLYKPARTRELRTEVIEAQLKALGPLTTSEKLALATVFVSLVGFVTQPWHAVNNAWVAMFCFLILYASAILDEKTVRADINWNQLISFGSLVGFSSVIAASGLTGVMAGHLNPYFAAFADNEILFLLVFSLAVHALRFFLPIHATLLVGILSVLPIIPALGIHPFVIALVALISSNPWIASHQNTHYRNIHQGSEGKLFTHRQTLTLAILHVAIVLISIAIAVPYWKQLGLIG